MNRALSIAVALGVSMSAASARAQGADAPPTAKSEAPSPALQKAQYALPFAMRPIAPTDLVRIDMPYAVQDAQVTIPSTITAGGKVAADLGLYGRVGVVRNAPETGSSATVLSNPLLYALYSPRIAPKVRLPIFAGVALPFGAGGGNEPDKTSKATLGSGVYARQAMDNALFASNYLTPTVGVGIGYVDRGLTLQVDTQVLQLFRVKGAAVDADERRTNFTAGVNVGYLIADLVNVNAELHYQRWLSTPAVVERDSAYRDQLTIGGGARVNVPLTDKIVARPGLAYFQGLDAPMTTLGHRIVMVDVPVVF